ncbi:MAG: hypothetical protein P8Z68_06800 [Kineosporiaceae bacterium]
MPAQITDPVVAAAERIAVGVLIELSGGCVPTRILAGNTKRGPVFVYLCPQGPRIDIVSIPVGGLRNRAPDDPTSRTRVASYPLSGVTVETGAYIESDGTVRALFTVHVPADDDREWEIIAESVLAVGQAVTALRAAARGEATGLAAGRG